MLPGSAGVSGNLEYRCIFKFLDITRKIRVIPDAFQPLDLPEYLGGHRGVILYVRAGQIPFQVRIQHFLNMHYQILFLLTE